MFLLVLYAASCGSNPFDGQTEFADTLGEWAESDLTCERNRDCFDGETCVQGSCQIERCAANVDGSVAPMGKGLSFLAENEVAFIDETPYKDGYWIDGYRPVGVGDPYDFSQRASSDPLLDVAGGNFDGSRTEQYAVAVSGSSQIEVPALGTRVNAGFVPVALAAGDADGDGLDEVIALSSTGTLAICHVDERDCDTWNIDGGGDPADVTAGDIDGDAIDEPILLLHSGGDAYLFAFHADDSGVGEDYFGRIESDDVHRVTAGDVDGDLVAEVIGLKECGWLGFCDDELHLFDALSDGTFRFRYFSDVENHTEVRDIQAGDVDQDDVIEVATVSADRLFTLEAADSTGFEQLFSTQLTVSNNPNRVAMADHDGDAPRAELMEGPERIAGDVVPVMVMLLPPYHQDYSSGQSSVSYGDGESVSESLSDTVSLGVSADIGTNPSFFGLFGVKLSAKVDRSVSATVGTRRRLSVGSRYSLRADPAAFGPNYGGVVVGWGCFDAYRYRIDDPQNRLAQGGDRADGEDLVITVPVGGGEALYSSTRYNAMAEALGLPQVNIPVTVGDPDSYPTRPERLNGRPIPEEALLFPTSDSFRVSDVGQVSWRNLVSESESNTQNVSTNLGVSAGVEAWGVSVGGGVSAGWGQSYSLEVGTSAMFIGGIPPIPDNTRTPEDEYAEHQYSVTPWIYQQGYKDADGNDAAYWVMTYSVAP